MKYTKQISLKYVAVVAMSLTMVACVGTKQLSHNISRDGQVQAENVIFPDLSKAWQKQGQFPNSENLAKIRAGVSKDELYQLIGRPHFSEAQYAREWDYIMKFYRPDESVQICQYKVIFDDKYNTVVSHSFGILQRVISLYNHWRRVIQYHQWLPLAKPLLFRKKSP